jgi:uncharacterized membrane protein YcaP (DUF421 family)
MWWPTVAPLELMLRSAVVYGLFLFALRVSGKRELGQFTIFDLALVLLAANALQPAITGPDASIGGAVVILATLFCLNRLVALARSRLVTVRRLLDPQPTTIARDGAWIPAAIAREGLSEDDLDAALREHGVESIAGVSLAVLEQDGSVSVVPGDGAGVRMAARRRRYRHRAPGSD